MKIKRVIKRIVPLTMATIMAMSYNVSAAPSIFYATVDDKLVKFTARQIEDTPEIEEMLIKQFTNLLYDTDGTSGINFYVSDNEGFVVNFSEARQNGDMTYSVAKNELENRAGGDLFNKVHDIDEDGEITDTYIDLSIVDEPVIELEGINSSEGYEGEVTVKINVPNDMVVFYTIDGTTPTMNSNVYRNEFKVSKDTGDVVVKAIAVNSVFATSKIASTTIEFVGESTTVLKGISISSLPEKLEYIVGDELSLEGLVVTGEYDILKDGEATGETLTKVENVFSSEPSAGDVLDEVGTQTITVTVDDKTATFTIKTYASQHEAGDWMLKLISGEANGADRLDPNGDGAIHLFGATGILQHKSLEKDKYFEFTNTTGEIFIENYKASGTLLTDGEIDIEILSQIENDDVATAAKEFMDFEVRGKTAKITSGDKVLLGEGGAYEITGDYVDLPPFGQLYNVIKMKLMNYDKAGDDFGFEYILIGYITMNGTVEVSVNDTIIIEETRNWTPSEITVPAGSEVIVEGGSTIDLNGGRLILDGGTFTIKNSTIEGTYSMLKMDEHSGMYIKENGNLNIGDEVAIRFEREDPDNLSMTSELIRIYYGGGINGLIAEGGTSVWERSSDERLTFGATTEYMMIGMSRRDYVWTGNVTNRGDNIYLPFGDYSFEVWGNSYAFDKFQY